MKIQKILKLAETLDKLNKFEKSDILMQRLCSLKDKDFEKIERYKEEQAAIVACFLYDGPMVGYGIERRQPMRLIGWEVLDSNERFNQEEIMEKYITEPNSQKLILFIVPKQLAEIWKKRRIIHEDPYIVESLLYSFSTDDEILHMPERYSDQTDPLDLFITKHVSPEKMTPEEIEELRYMIEQQEASVKPRYDRDMDADQKRFEEIMAEARFDQIMEGVLKEDTEEDE